MPPPPPAPPISKATPASSHDEPWVVDGDADDQPPWATAERDVSVWYTMLKDKGADSASIQNVFALAQYSEEGYFEANALIAKVIKKEADGETINNISGFLHKCSQNSLYKIDRRVW